MSDADSGADATCQCDNASCRVYLSFHCAARIMNTQATEMLAMHDTNDFLGRNLHMNASEMNANFHQWQNEACLMSRDGCSYRRSWLHRPVPHSSKLCLCGTASFRT